MIPFHFIHKKSPSTATDAIALRCLLQASAANEIGPFQALRLGGKKFPAIETMLDSSRSMATCVKEASSWAAATQKGCGAAEEEKMFLGRA